MEHRECDRFTSWNPCHLGNPWKAFVGMVLQTWEFSPSCCLAFSIFLHHNFQLLHHLSKFHAPWYWCPQAVSTLPPTVVISSRRLQSAGPLRFFTFMASSKVLLSWEHHRTMFAICCPPEKAWLSCSCYCVLWWFKADHCVELLLEMPH
jgi:hypothetical protein